ncbi:MAG: dihydroneopterin aldolase [Bacillota bacterium]
MDKILLNNLAFYGYHGVLDEEQELGQKFFIDVELSADLSLAGTTDDLKQAVNYAEVYQVIKEICEEEQYDLLEALAENMAQKILEQFELVQEVQIRVKKPEAPIEGIFDYAGVELKRTRK